MAMAAMAACAYASPSTLPTASSSTSPSSQRNLSLTTPFAAAASAQGQPHSFRSSSPKTPFNLVISWKISPHRGRRLVAMAKLLGQDPEFSEDDYMVLGLAHCFVKDEDAKLKDVFVIEPITSATLECMENGGKTSYKHATATTLGVALKQDAELLPAELRVGQFADDFAFRAKCASRTWKRAHPQKNLLHLVPRGGGVRSDFNFCLDDKRILNLKVVVTDADNIKQDMSIDVYGRAEEEEQVLQTEVSSLYNV